MFDKKNEMELIREVSNDMHIGCKYKVGDIIKGLMIIAEPYKIGKNKNYYARVRCLFCGREYDIVISEIKRHVFDGCGCQVSRCNSIRWQSFEDWCKENDSENLLDLWDYDLNNVLPSQISRCTHDKYYFKCVRGIHDSELHNIDKLTVSKRVKPLCTKCNSIAQHLIDKFGKNALDLYWDFDKNDKDPWKISFGTHEFVWIKCPDVSYHPSYCRRIGDLIIKGIGCPYCHKNLVHPNDSFAAYCIEHYGDDFLQLYWDYELNTVDPWTIAPFANNIKVFIKCYKNSEHDSHYISLANFHKNINSCPQCLQETECSSLQKMTKEYLSQNYTYQLFHEYACSIVAINPSTGRSMPYDNEVLIDDLHLIIEVHGDQHFRSNSGWNRKKAERHNTTVDEALKEQQYRDRIKEAYVNSLQDYYYLALPYWTFKDDSYKTIINNKIQEVLNSTKLMCAV